MNQRILFFLLMLASASVAVAQGWQWQHNVLTNSDENFNAMTCDREGNVFVGFQFNNLLQIGSYTFQTNPVEDVCVAKYDSLGNVLWAQAFGGLYWDQINGMACDSAGNVFVAGHFTSELFFFNTSVVGSTGRDIFIIRINADGTFGWIQTGANIWDEEASDIIVTQEGDVIVSGMANNTSVIGGMELISETPNVYMQDFIAKFSNDGQPLWIRSGGATDYSSNSYSRSTLALGPDGSIHLGIPRTGGLNFAGQVSEGPANYNTVILKWDSDGNPLWGWVGLSDGNDFIRDIAVDDQGRVYTAVSTVMAGSFGGQPFEVVPGDWGLAFIRLLPDGSEDRLWLATGARRSDVFALVHTVDNRIWLAGMQRYTTFFPFGTITAGSVDDRQGFMCALNANTDEFEELSRVHGDGWQFIYGGCTDSSGKLYFGGDMSGSVGAPVYFGMQNELTDEMYIQGKTLPFVGRYNSIGCDSPTAIFQNQTIEFCNGDVVSLGPDIPIYGFQWSDGVTHEIEVSLAGSYYLNAITLDGCIVRDTISVAVEQAPQLNWVLQPVNCSGAFDGGIAIEVLGSNPPYSLTWNGNPVANQFGEIGAGLYTLVAASDAGCSTATLIEIAEPDPLEVDYSALFNDATGLGTLTVNQISGGTPPYTVLWPSHPQAEFVLEGVEEGSYVLQVSDNAGCSQEFNLILTTDIDDVSMSDLMCYPQPATDNLIVEAQEPFTFELFDVKGNAVLCSRFQGVLHSIDVSRLPVGIYVLSAKASNGSMRTLEMVKQ